MTQPKGIRPPKTARWLDIIDERANVIYLAVEWDFQNDAVRRFDRGKKEYVWIPFETVCRWRLRDSAHQMGRKRWNDGPAARPQRR